MREQLPGIPCHGTRPATGHAGTVQHVRSRGTCIPVTGQPLPLISKGGTSTIINCIYIYAILSVSRSAKKTSEPQPMKVATDNAAADDKETNV